MSVSTTRRAHVVRWSPMFPSCLKYPARSFARRVLQQTRTALFRLLGLIEEIAHDEKFDVIVKKRIAGVGAAVTFHGSGMILRGADVAVHAS